MRLVDDRMAWPQLHLLRHARAADRLGQLEEKALIVRLDQVPLAVRRAPVWPPLVREDVAVAERCAEQLALVVLQQRLGRRARFLQPGGAVHGPEPAGLRAETDCSELPAGRIHGALNSVRP